jgi:hypothetical protein
VATTLLLGAPKQWCADYTCQAAFASDLHAAYTTFAVPRLTRKHYLVILSSCLLSSDSKARHTMAWSDCIANRTTEDRIDLLLIKPSLCWHALLQVVSQTVMITMPGSEQAMHTIKHKHTDAADPVSEIWEGFLQYIIDDSTLQLDDVGIVLFALLLQAPGIPADKSSPTKSTAASPAVPTPGTSGVRTQPAAAAAAAQQRQGPAKVRDAYTV